MTGYHFNYGIEAVIQEHLDTTDDDVFYALCSPDPLVGHDTPVAYWVTTAWVRVNLFRRHKKKWLAASFLLDPDCDDGDIKKKLNQALASFRTEIKQHESLLVKQ